MTATKCITQFLDSESVRYEVDHHDACFSAQALAAEEGMTGYRVAKTVVCLADERLVILVLPASCYVDLEVVGAELDAEVVCLADPAAMASFFPDCGIEVAPPPLPLWDNVRIHADTSMMGGNDIVFAAGTANDAIRMGRMDWVRIARPTIGQFAMPIPPATESSVTTVGVVIY